MAEPASSTAGYLVDTSIFIAAERQRRLGDPPDGHAHISVATITELGLGARRAATNDLRTLRSATLERARRFIALPYDEAVADQLADLLATAQARQRRAGAMDAIIAATALVHQLAVWTQDDDFAVLAELEPSLIVKDG
jgi:predicted nucleic acid-binding protein